MARAIPSTLGTLISPQAPPPPEHHPLLLNEFCPTPRLGLLLWEAILSTAQTVVFRSK